MENEIYFGDIKPKLFELLQNSKKYIWVAVAWITDTDYLQILEDKIRNGIDVKVVIMNDDFNRQNLKKLNFLIENKNLFLRESHHKYCIIDDEVLVTGSYNWTNRAMQRLEGENILVAYSKDAIAETKKNFISITTGEIVEVKTKTDFYISKVLELSYGELAFESDINWWLSLTEDWKIFFLDEVCQDFEAQSELHEYYKQLSLEELEGDSFDFWEIDKIEKYALNEFLILIMNMAEIKTPINLTYEFDNVKPLIHLKKIKFIKEISFNNSDEFVILTKSNKNLTISNISISEYISSDLISNRIAENLKEIDLGFNYCDERIFEKFANKAEKIRLYGHNSSNVYINWFLKFKKLKRLELNQFFVYRFNVVNTLLEQVNSLVLDGCYIHDASNDFNPEIYKNLFICNTCRFWTYSQKGHLLEMLNELYEIEQEEEKQQQKEDLIRTIGNSEYKFFDENGKRYKFVEEYVFEDENGNEFDCYGHEIRDVEGNDVYPYGTKNQEDKPF